VTSTPPSDWIRAARSARLGEVADIADWYEQARITVVADDAGTRVVEVTGDLASGTAAYLDVVLEHQIAARPPGLAVDLSAASFIGVRGLATLLRAADRARRQDLPLRLVVGEQADVPRMLARTGAAELLGVRHSLHPGRSLVPSPMVGAGVERPPAGPGGAAESAVSIAVDRDDDHALMTVRGELTVDGVGAVTQVLTELLLDTGQVVIDLSHLHVDWVPAVQLFPSTLAATGGWPFARLVLFGASPELARVLHAVGVTDTVPLAHDHSAALTQLDRRPDRLTRYHVLEAHLGSPRRARALLRRACLDWALDGAYDEAALVVTELVMNAVRHTGMPCRLDVTFDDDGLRVAVRDQGTSPTALLDGHLNQCGAGLRVVATLSHRWGVVRHPDGKTVWALFTPRRARTWAP
jgi:anti-anti-sigma factor